jgi:hypothetical protein
VPGNKKLADIIVKIPDVLNDRFEIKFSGGCDRAQLSTLKNILPEIRDKFLNRENGILSLDEKRWLINTIDEENKNHAYTLSFFVKKHVDEYEVAIFDFDSLDLSKFVNHDFYIKKVSKEERTEIFIKLSNNVSIQICSGRNPYNRGIWLNGIFSYNDLDIIESTDFIKILTKKKRTLSFNKHTYMMKKAKKTLEIIDSL